MFIYYTLIILICIFALITMIATVKSNRMLSNLNKRGFSITAVLVIVVAISEWLCLYSEMLGYEYRVLNVIGALLILSLSPAIPIFLANSILKLENNEYFFGIIAFNVLAEISSLFNGKIFYVNSYNVYKRGDFYFIYVMTYSIAIIVLFYSLFMLSKMYQGRYNIVIVCILMLLLSTVAMQMSDSTMYVTWLGATISLILIYSFYCALFTQVDVLTSLLNRRCYENKIRDIREDSVIIFFDINNFKVLNDTFGHTFGDKALTQIAKIIKQVYSKHGMCYRTGGDEFCVVMSENLENIESINAQFSNEIQKRVDIDYRMPFVSVGYASYYNETSSIHDVLDQADKMMYEAKSRKHLGAL